METLLLVLTGAALVCSVIALVKKSMGLGCLAACAAVGLLVAQVLLLVHLLG